MSLLARNGVLGLAAVLSVATISGCGSAEDPTVPVSGNVTLDGQPLPSGRITFLPSDGKGAVAGAEVATGKYEARVTPGPKQVTVTAQREAAAGKKPVDPHAGPSQQQYLPARYNTKTELKTDVSVEGSDAIDFPLESGKS